MSDTTLNLDKVAAEKAQAMVKNAKDSDTLERLVTKALAVLQEQGVYAMMLLLFSRTGDENKVAPAIRAQCFSALKALPEFANDDAVPEDSAGAQMALEFYSQHVLQNWDNLLLVRDLYEQTLIYARFGAKAEGK